MLWWHWAGVAVLVWLALALLFLLIGVGRTFLRIPKKNSPPLPLAERFNQATAAYLWPNHIRPPQIYNKFVDILLWPFVGIGAIGYQIAFILQYPLKWLLFFPLRSLFYLIFLFIDYCKAKQKTT